jgi:N6-L-threonylcarbamoyladenine synthase
MRAVTVLGIETSCDETAAAVLRLENGKAQILADIIHSQIEAHAPYQGVVPEIAARAHADLCDHAVGAALREANLTVTHLDAIAATSGPGLIGGVLVGLMTGKAIAQASGKPFFPINHLEGHALSPRLSADCAFPYLLLLASGGHCQFIEVRGLGDYRRLGSTIDDAAGEAFDKAAKVLGLGFPGGPAVERLAAKGNPAVYAFPRPKLKDTSLEMSFAGLKTAFARAAEGVTEEGAMADLCASFQAAIADIFGEKSSLALAAFDPPSDEKRFVVAGGVAANKTLRARLEKVASQHGARLIAPPLRHCTDNAAMIALAGAERFAAGLIPEHSLNAPARPRWPLDEVSSPAYGSGKRGAKA